MTGILASVLLANEQVVDGEDHVHLLGVLQVSEVNVLVQHVLGVYSYLFIQLLVGITRCGNSDIGCIRNSSGLNQLGLSSCLSPHLSDIPLSL